MDHEDYEAEACTDHSLFPTFLPSEVAVPYDSLLSHVRYHSNKVFVGDQLLFYKPSWSQQGLIEDIEKYSRIAKSGLSVQELRTFVT